MRIKRVLQGTALTALAAAAWMGAGTVDASAAEFPFQNVHIYSVSEDEEVTTPTMGIEVPDGCKEIMFGVASGNETKGVKIADTAWDVYDVEEDSVSIDLSKLSITKDNYVAVKSESTDPIYIKIGSSVTSQQTKYNSGTGKLEITIKKAASTEKVDNVDWEYRTAYGSWIGAPFYSKSTETVEGEKPPRKYDADKIVFTEYQPQGATLYVRAGAKLNYELEKTTKTIKDAAVKDGSKTYSLYDGGLMPGKESKVSIAKMANGPSVSADYVNGKVNIPAKTEYRVIASGGAITGDKTKDNAPIQNASKDAKSVRDLLDISSKTATSGVIEVRKAATDKKAASKWTRVAIEIPDNIVVNAGIDEKHTITATGAATEGKVAEGITITPQTKKDKSYSGTIEVKAGTYDINVKIGATGKAVVVKANGTKKISKATDVIYIGKAGNKKGKVWASGYVPVGKAE